MHYLGPLSIQEIGTAALCFQVVRTGVDKGGTGGPRGPSSPPQWRAKKKGRGYFYQMSNMYTCIAYLIEIRKFCSKNLVHKVSILRPKCSKTHLRAPLIRDLRIGRLRSNRIRIESGVRIRIRFESNRPYDIS